MKAMRAMRPFTFAPWAALALAACASEPGAAPSSQDSGALPADDAAAPSPDGGAVETSPDSSIQPTESNDSAAPPSEGPAEDAGPLAKGHAPEGPADSAPTIDSGPPQSPPPAGDAGPTGGCNGSSSSALVGWASVDGMGVASTTGGAGGSMVTVSTLADFNTNAGGTTARIIQVSGTISGSVTVGSNKTIVGLCGAEVHGHIQMTGSVNVIVRNLRVVGYNCTDNTSDCSAGADAITVERMAHHLWFDHDDISDGSDGNLDITHACDFVTVSWTKFHYSGRRTDPAGASGGHQFSNLIGHSDSNASEDTGHLTVTFHHDWWADNVVERMPRVRFGRVHLFNNLYTAVGDDYCIGVGVSANIRDENNVFVGVKNPIDSTSYSNGASILQTSGDLDQMTSGTTQGVGGNAFMPPYTYSLEATSGLQTEVQNGAGPH
jgi:pectate lyase